MGETNILRFVVTAGASLSVAAILGVVAMWGKLNDAVDSTRDQLNRIEAQAPLQEQLRAIENEQMRQGIQLNANEVDVINMEIRDLEDRIEALERQP